jgi:hypothetical protein
VVSTTNGSSDSVTSLPTGPLGNGAECYCIANNSVYRFNSTSTQTTLGDTYLHPASGSGCWFKQAAGQDYAQGIQGTLAFEGSTIGALTINVWATLPSGVNFYQAAPVTSALWTMSTTNGVFVYNGAPGLKFLVNTTITIDGQASQSFDFDLTLNGLIVGTTSDTNSAARNTAANPLNDTQFAHNTIITPVNGSSYQHVIRCLTAAPASTIFAKYQVMITEA